MNEEPKPTEPKDIINTCYSLGRIGATVFTVFTRGMFGVWGLKPAFFSGMFIVLYGALTNRPVLTDRYLPAWLIAVIYRRLTYDRVQVSSYWGMPFWGLIKNERLAQLLEIALLFGVGYLVKDPPLSQFFWIGGVCLVIQLNIQVQLERTMRIAHEDALKHQQLWSRR